jgi:anthranilate synthase component 2/putative glutamine amidotransferase
VRTNGQPPIVGLSTYSVRADWGTWSDHAVLTPRSYTRCLTRSGAIPVLLAPAPPAAVDRILDAIDGLVLIGGEDICGRFYGREEAEDEHEAEAHNVERDEFEIRLARGAWSRDMPVLGICRGLQLLNVALNGTLIPDVAHVGAFPEHRNYGTFTPHPVSADEGTRIHDLMGARPDVPSHHHQAIDRLGAGLVATAYSSDGIVEAAEAPDKHFAVGVQWHPEEGTEMALFDAFVEACGGQG